MALGGPRDLQEKPEARTDAATVLELLWPGRLFPNET
jgi:hypothetical protein